MQQLTELQDKIVHCFANGTNERWDYLMVNFEWEEDDKEVVSETHEELFQREGDTWKSISVIPPSQCTGLLKELARGMSKDGKQKWSGCTLEVDSNGKYRFSFNYGPPKYLHAGIEVERMAGYTPRPLP